MRWVLAGERPHGDVVILDLDGKMEMCDIDTELPARVARLLAEGRLKFVLNLERVLYVDSSGLGGILRAYAQVRKRDGDLKLVNVARRILTMLEATKLLNVLEVFDSEERAVASFGQASV
jgi:anti-anti-sigma factor